MAKRIKFNENVKLEIKKGVNQLADAVKVTMGPKGRTVIIEDEDNDSLPHITKDGVTVAKAIDLEDRFQNVGAKLLREVAIKTANESGDGTTTSTVLAATIFNIGDKIINENKINPILFKRQFDKYVKIACDYIASKSIPIKNDYDKIKSVATISANNDEFIGEVVAKAFKFATSDGMISIEETSNSTTNVVNVEGLQVDKGYESPYFVTDSIKMMVEYDDPLFLVYDKKIMKPKDIFKPMEFAAKSERPLIIIADGFDEEVMSNLIANQMRGALNVCALRAPGFGVNKIKLLEDICVVTGTTFIKDEYGTFLKDFDPSWLGSSKKFKADKNTSLIIEGSGSESALENQIIAIKAMLSNEDIPYQTKEFYQDRLAKINGGVVIIKIGGSSEMEVKEIHDRLDDAICATRAAIEEGIVPGAGSTYLRTNHYLNSTIHPETLEQKAALQVLSIALVEPLAQMCINAGYDFTKIKKSIFASDDNKGLNLITEEIEDLIESGIIDPVKVTRIALENAASIASLFLTTDCVIVNN